jgi:hypothetical protein
MLKIILFIELSCIVCISYNIHAQEKDYIIINGETIDVDREPVSFVNIVVSGKGIGAISKSDGKFSIKVQVSDTLVFSSIEYKKLKIPVIMLNQDYNYVTLHQQIYELDEIDIMAARWQDFKYEMMETELQPIEQNVIAIKGLPNPYTKLVPVSLIGSPVSLLYELLKKENVRKRKQKRWKKIYENSCIKVE